MPVVRKQVAVRDGCRDQLHDLSMVTGQTLIGVFHLTAHEIDSRQRRGVRGLDGDEAQIVAMKSGLGVSGDLDCRRRSPGLPQ